MIDLDLYYDPLIDPYSWTLLWSYYLPALVGGYVLGSIPFGVVLTRLAGVGDVRKIGSGNIGATNVLRTGRKGLAAATLFLDGAKGAVAVLIAYYVCPVFAWASLNIAWPSDFAVLAGLGAVLGHLFPVWLKFKGGKGVATTLGVLLGISPPIGLAACSTWVLIAAVFRFSSLAALIAIAIAPIYVWLLPMLWIPSRKLFNGDVAITGLAAVLAVLVWITHRENIRRLLRGEEPQIGGHKGRAA